MSRLELVTLASIVEGEARVDAEREIIAGVYRNRLRIGMALQADPTVQYAISLKRGKRKSRLFEKDYQFNSPYNTYLNPGLPPGPVNSPSLRSLEASLYPADVRYLYFVAGPDGLAPLVALSRGGSLTVTCEWTGAGLIPLAVHLDDRSVDLGPHGGFHERRWPQWWAR